jgi:hypothetical protein
MATGKLLPTRTAVTLSGAFDSVTNGNYAISPAIDVSAIDPVDLVIELAITPGVTSGDEAVYVFAKVSFDGGVTYTSGPESGSTTTSEPDLYYIDYLPLSPDNTLQRKAFNVRQALGFIPPHFKIVIKNSTGTTLSTGNTLHYITYLADIA